MALNAFLSNQGTQTSLLTDNTGGTAGTLIPVMKIDTSASGTAGVSMFNGTMGISGGTTPFTSDITTAGTLSGTQSLPMNADGLTTISAQITNTFTGTVLAEASLNGGTTWNPTTMVILNSGSIANSLTGPALVQISAAGLGSVRLRANTISSGSAFIYMRGNVGAANVMLDNALPVGANIIGNIGTVTTGTIASVTNLAGGTVKQDPRPSKNIVSFGTQVSGTAATAATIVGSASVGAGTSLWVNNLSINNPNANVGVIIGFGTAQQGTNVLHRGTFGTSGAVGVVVPFPSATNAGMTNQDLVVSLTAAGTVDVNVSYFISA